MAALHGAHILHTDRTHALTHSLSRVILSLTMHRPMRIHVRVAAYARRLPSIDLRTLHLVGMIKRERADVVDGRSWAHLEVRVLIICILCHLFQVLW